MEVFCGESNWPQAPAHPQIEHQGCPDTDQLDTMFGVSHQQHHQGLALEDFRVLTPEFDTTDEDPEMAAARDVVAHDLKVLQEQCGDTGAAAATPPPQLQVAHPYLQGVYLKQEASGAAGSSCGASSPQASCDTAAANKAQQFWAATQHQQQQYDAAGFAPMLLHLPGPSSHQYPPAGPMPGPYASTAVGLGMPSMPPCTGPCCYPQGPLAPQGSCSLSFAGVAPGPADYASFSPQGYPSPAGAMPAHPARAGLPGSMVPSAGAFNSLLGMARTSSSTPAGLMAPAQQQGPSTAIQRAYGSYPSVLQGGVQKRSSTAGAKALGAAAGAAPGSRKSADGSCSSKDGGSPAPAPRPKKGNRGAGGRASSASVAAAVAVTGSASSVIKELQQEIEALTASKAELKTQVRTLLTSQTDLLTRVATLTTKWQQAVAENAALHRQNLALAASQCL